MYVYIHYILLPSEILESQPLVVFGSTLSSELIFFIEKFAV